MSRITIKEIGQFLLLLVMSAVSLPALSLVSTPFDVKAPWEWVQSVDGAEASDENSANVLLFSEETEAEPLLSQQSLGDSIVSLEVWLAEDASAGLYLQGRYEIVLAPSDGNAKNEVSDMGALAPRWSEHREPQAYAGVIPSSNAAKAAGEWQTVEIRFRAPRYNEAGQKTDSALFLEVTVNGETVQRNTIATGFTRGSINAWETSSGPLMLKVHKGPVAVRNVSVAHADFGSVTLPTESGGDTNEKELQDFVALGEKTFKALGCSSCHAVNEGEASVRAGPNLFGLFQNPARDRLVKEGDSDTRFTLKADRSYLHHSVREPDTEIAIGESGSNDGEAFMPIMPAYSQDTLKDSELDAIGAYLTTLNPLSVQGPVVQLVAEGGPEAYDPLADGLQRLVLDEAEVQRGPMQGTSGRAIHVGLPNGVNYSFDPRVLGVVKLWQGGFLNMEGELRNRGGGGLAMGYNSREIDLNGEVLFAPLLPSGEPVDFSFKDAVFGDMETVHDTLYAKEDFSDQIASVDARFRGYRIDSTSPEQSPDFDVEVGKNRFSMGLAIESTGKLTLTVSGSLKDKQQLQLSEALLTNVRVSKGRVNDGIWELPAKTRRPVTLTAQIKLSSNPWRPPATDFEYARQPLKIVPSDAALLDGYAIEDYLPPKDNYGRDLLFEALGLAVAEDGTIVVVTRTAGIWRIVDGEWHLFAEGLFDSLGVVIEDKHGLDLVVSQKAELTRVRDTNGDKRADRFETLFDGFGYHNNYHTYMHGPVKGTDGAYYFGLNLAHTDDSVYKADGLYMGSQGGYSGWAFRVTPDGDVKPWAYGLRSAAGWTVGPDKQIWITENQGEFVGTSKLFVLKEGQFYGHPSSLVDLPGMTPDSPEIAWEKVQDKRPPELLLMPQNLLANSPGHPVWDLTKGQFGPFEGQMLIGDQTQSNLFRVALETLPDGTVQGGAMPFARELASGAMRPIFLPDGSLLLGQTGRGWQAKGGHVASLQRLVWRGDKAPQAIQRMNVTENGFTVHFVRPLPGSLSDEALRSGLAMSSWTYRDAPDYGSERLGLREEAIADLNISDDRKSVTLTLETTEIPQVHPQQTGRVYYLEVTAEALTSDHDGVPMSVFYTLHHFRR
ncbi:family 16 glycoside hydrolase [Marinimicrobium sp. ARAG 43.8]|uniref:family 16 glycoside hydrolase n=1 Tax=Marinimicrobium sp. ARAG 43.8 TaxID=3418719 RepID=UPI003CECE657